MIAPRPLACKLGRTPHRRPHPRPGREAFGWHLAEETGEAQGVWGLSMETQRRLEASRKEVGLYAGFV